MVPPYSWSVPGRKPGTSTNVTNRTLNASHMRTKRAAFSDAAMSSGPAGVGGWVPDEHADVAVDAREAAHDVHRPVLMHFEEVAVVDDLGDHGLHVVRLVR